MKMLGRDPGELRLPMTQLEDSGMVVVGRRGKHGYVANAVWHEHEAVPACVDARDVADRLAQTADFHAQPRAVRFVCMSGTKSACKQRFAGRIFWPCFRQRTREREQHRPCLKRDRFARKAYGVTEGIDEKLFHVIHCPYSCETETNV